MWIRRDIEHQCSSNKEMEILHTYIVQSKNIGDNLATAYYSPFLMALMGQSIGKQTI